MFALRINFPTNRGRKRTAVRKERVLLQLKKKKKKPRQRTKAIEAKISPSTSGNYGRADFSLAVTKWTELVVTFTAAAAVARPVGSTETGNFAANRVVAGHKFRLERSGEHDISALHLLKIPSQLMTAERTYLGTTMQTLLMYSESSIQPLSISGLMTSSRGITVRLPLVVASAFKRRGAKWSEYARTHHQQSKQQNPPLLAVQSCQALRHFCDIHGQLLQFLIHTGHTLRETDKAGRRAFQS